jgi:hypothetical protein
LIFQFLWWMSSTNLKILMQQQLNKSHLKPMVNS